MRNLVRKTIIKQQKRAHIRIRQIIPRRRPKLQEMEQTQYRQEQRRSPKSRIPLETRVVGYEKGGGEGLAYEEGTEGNAGLRAFVAWEEVFGGYGDGCRFGTRGEAWGCVQAVAEFRF